ncbi:MAG: response regulator [Burkholderiales bacterium]
MEHKRVFVVEDETFSSMILCRQLNQLGYVVCGTASQGDAALAGIESARPDIVMMDINLNGDMDGLEVARRLRETYPVPVVFLTAYTESEVVASASTVGAYGFLVKPFQERELHATIQVALARGEFDRQMRDLNSSLEERVRSRTAQLEQAMANLKEANRAKDVFLENMSHEMRTPLNHIIGLAEVLKSLPAAGPNASALRCAEKIGLAGWRLAQYVESLLDLKAIQQAPMDLSMTPIRIAQVIDEAVELTTPMATAKHLRIQWRPTALHEAHAIADHDRLMQVLLCLLSNAVKYNRSGGQINIELREKDGLVAISITDTGEGMTIAQQARAFEPFARFVPQGEVIGGIGIGLTVANRIATSMGGQLALQSRHGQGTTASLRLRCHSL